jgi:hypothetical protein
MGHIYKHAACTIAATASKDSNGGLFFARRPLSLIPRQVNFEFSPKPFWLEGKDDGFALVGKYLCDVAYLGGRWIEQAPLNSRAWVSQERQLSRRLLHFTSTQLFWECNECSACETYPERLPYHAKSFSQDDATILKEQLHLITDQDKDSSPLSAQGLDDITYHIWGMYRMQYSRCALTHNSDKLVAMQGIAHWVSQATGDEFVAGLWRSRIIEELCWIKEDPITDIMEWRAPSWSWACRNGRIDYSFLSKFHRGHSSRHIEAELFELDVKAKISGELEDASVKIKCKVLHVVFRPAVTLNPPRNDIHGLLELIDQDGEILECRTSSQTAYPGVEFHMDDDTKFTGPQYGYMVVLQHCVHEGNCRMSDDIERSFTEQGEEGFDSEEDSEGPEANEEDALEALFLQMRDKVKERFERMGLIRCERFQAALCDMQRRNEVLKTEHPDTLIRIVQLRSVLKRRKRCNSKI